MDKLKRILKWLGWLLCFFLLLSILSIASLRWINPPSSSFMLMDKLFSGHRQVHHWVPLKKISPELWIAVVAAEDQKFPHHYGFDIDSIVSAVNENRKRKRGASTISQQVAKNLFLWKGRSYIRKGLEAYITILMELCWPKERILEVYLNIAEFGRGVYGAEAAARQYFAVPALHLNRDESALLAAVLPNPKRMYVSKPSAYVRERAFDIKLLIKALGGPAYLQF